MSKNQNNKIIQSSKYITNNILYTVFQHNGLYYHYLDYLDVYI